MTIPVRPVPTADARGAQHLPVQLLLTLFAVALPGLLFSAVLLDRIAGSERALHDVGIGAR